MTEFKEHYVVYLKGGQTVEVSLEMFPIIENGLMGDKGFIKIGENIYNKFEIQKMEKFKPANDVEAYILAQPKHIRDKINQYAKANDITWNNVEHVSNFIDANK